MYSQNTCFYNPSFIVCHIDSENHSENDNTRRPAKIHRYNIAYIFYWQKNFYAKCKIFETFQITLSQFLVICPEIDRSSTPINRFWTLKIATWWMNHMKTKLFLLRKYLVYISDWIMHENKKSIFWNEIFLFIINHIWNHCQLYRDNDFNFIQL